MDPGFHFRSFLRFFSYMHKMWNGLLCGKSRYAGRPLSLWMVWIIQGESPRLHRKMDAKFANKFAADWISAWNEADLSEVLIHYTDDFEMSSPYIQSVFGEPSGTLVGKERVRAYWQMMLSKYGAPRFELVDVFTGAGSIAIEYRNRGRKAVEIFFFNESGLVNKAAAHYPDGQPSDTGREG
jgi:hypothetical protein